MFDIKNNNYIGNIGVKGQGPNEFLQPFSLVYSSDGRLLSYDVGDYSLKSIDIDSLINGTISYNKILDSNSMSHLTVFPVEESNYIGFGIYSENMFKLIDSNGNIIRSFMNYPIENSTMDHRNIAMAYQGALAINNDKSKLVYASMYGTILCIYDISKNLIDEEFSLVLDYPHFSPRNERGSTSSPLTKDAISAFRDIYVTDKYIYSLYSGKNISEFKQNAFEAQSIYIFDWTGKPIIRYLLDVRVNNIAVDPNNQKIYALSNLPESTLVEFEIDL